MSALKMTWFNSGFLKYLLVASIHVGLCASAEEVSKENVTTLKLTSDQPGVVDGPVGFFARLLGVEDNSTLYNYVWECGEVQFKKTITNQSLECNITLTVPTSGTYVMKLLVNSGVQTLAKAKLNFVISSTINGKIAVFQPDLHAKSPHVISTKHEANISFVLYDPQHYFDNYTFYYAWLLDRVIYSNDLSFRYNFSASQKYDIILMVAAFGASPYYATLSLQLDAKDPISSLNITGDTSIHHGDLLEVEVECEGSPPYSYCWRFTQNVVNSTAEECKDPTMTTSCDIIIVRYFPKSGNYKLVTIIDNDVDHQIAVYNINVFASAPEPQLSPIIVPLACSSLALVIIVIGVTYFIQAKRNYSIEVANFDFQQTDDIEFQSFCERLCGSFRNNFGRADKQKSFTYRRIPAQIT